MNDLISRQDAIDLVEELEMKYLRGEIELMYTHTIKGLMSLPSAQPKADVAPVVHSEVIPCKECKWHNYLTCSNPKGIKGWVTDNDYCSYRERREDGNIY